MFDLKIKTTKIMTKEKIIETIKIEMVKKDINQSRLHELTGISKPTISKIFHDKNWSTKTMVPILEELGLELDLIDTDESE